MSNCIYPIKEDLVEEKSIYIMRKNSWMPFFWWILTLQHSLIGIQKEESINASMLDVENGPSSHKIYLFLLLKPRRFRKSKQVHKRDKILEVKRQDIRKSVNFVLFHFHSSYKTNTRQWRWVAQTTPCKRPPLNKNNICSIPTKIMLYLYRYI
jgi:hypothetical protein